jgi:hypothetical protein
MIWSADQIPIARALLKEGGDSKDWINVTGIARQYGLNYYNTRHFMSKLATNGYMKCRIVKGRLIRPADYKFIGDGLSRLDQEYRRIVSGESQQVTTEFN